MDYELMWKNNTESNHNKITVIGPAILDVLAGPVDFSSIQIGSQPMKNIIVSCGGDALNEAIILKRLGTDVELLSKIGSDQAGKQIINLLLNEGVTCNKIKQDVDVATSINIVLVDGNGERYFLTNPSGSMRKLTEQDIVNSLDTVANIVSFAGMFSSSLLNIESMTRIFKKIKSVPGRILAVDMTKAKNGEKLDDLELLLKYVDYIFPNESEISILTGEKDVYKNAKLLIETGVKCAVIKRGKNGCLICNNEEYLDIPAYFVPNVIDSTGAGDSFVAGFLYGLYSGFTVKDCGVFANAVASCVVEYFGATQGFESEAKAYVRYKEMIKRE